MHFLSSHMERSNMALTFILILFVYCSLGLVQGTVVAPPKFDATYHVSGVISLPYTEINEPFEAWIDTPSGRSRIDYYGGMVITIQREDQGLQGTGYKIAPETTETQRNVQSCFQINGTDIAPVTIQSVLPNLDYFNFIGVDVYNGKKCEKWQNVTIVANKTNKYTMWVTTDDKPRPWHYEMKGYNSLLGSHYDKYLIDYMNYAAERIDPNVFEIPNGLKCGGFPGPGAEHRILANPIKEYINNHDHHVHEMFEQFKKIHNKDYDHREHEERKINFMHNVRYIHSSNRASKGYNLAVNHLADKTDKELTLLRGRLLRKGSNGGLSFDTQKYNVSDVPDTLDWRLFGAVTPVKDQAVCGSCWSFGTTGTIEGALFLKTGILVRLSQQNLVDCSWGFGNNGCDGGEEWRAYQWIMKHGLASEESYGPYYGADGYCHFENSTIAAGIKNYINVTSGDQKELKLAIAKHGPVAVGIDAAHKSLSFYSNGIYYEPQCGNKPENLDHAVLAVGYGTINGQSYWLIKNSWSTYWGNDGYVLMSQKDNNCGVATDATFVLM